MTHPRHALDRIVDCLALPGSRSRLSTQGLRRRPAVRKPPFIRRLVRGVSPPGHLEHENKSSDGGHVLEKWD